jgi:nucleotide-binding universal stress UspA family protein
MLKVRGILHPTDFSEPATHAFRLACSLAKDYGAPLVVLHVSRPPMMVTDGVMTPPTPQALEFDRPALEARLRKLVPPDPAVKIEHRFVIGAEADEILEAAADAHCDLIVMGTHGRTGLGRVLLGSVAEQVLRRAPCPVVTVKAPATGAAKTAIQRILYATDFSERSRVALQLASWLARDHKAELVILHAVPPPTDTLEEVITEHSTGLDREAAGRLLSQLTPAVPNVRFTRELKEGDPAAQILEAAKQNQCDLIVMGTHGRTGLARLVMGSVAEQVVRNTPCPVVTVKAPFAAAAS